LDSISHRGTEEKGFAYIVGARLRKVESPKDGDLGTYRRAAAAAAIAWPSGDAELCGAGGGDDGSSGAGERGKQGKRGDGRWQQRIERQPRFFLSREWGRRRRALGLFLSRHATRGNSEEKFQKEGRSMHG
jgi:hypothetical protein